MAIINLEGMPSDHLEETNEKEKGLLWDKREPYAALEHKCDNIWQRDPRRP
jgi:hypothetical protein